MDNQHKHIKGYRDLTKEEVAVMNAIKEKGEEVRQLIEDLEMTNADSRWLSIGRTDLQRGFMALVRSVAKPESF